MAILGHKYKCPRCHKLDSVNMPIQLDGERVMEGCTECFQEDMANVIEDAQKHGVLDELGQCLHCGSVYHFDRLQRTYGRNTRGNGFCPMCSVRWGKAYCLHKIKEK